MEKKRHFDLPVTIVYISTVLLFDTYLSAQAAFSMTTSLYFLFTILSGNTTTVILTIAVSISHISLYASGNSYSGTQETSLLILFIVGAFYIKSFTNCGKIIIIFYFILLNTLPFIINHLMLDYRFTHTYLNTYLSLACYLITGAVPWLMVPVLVAASHIHK